MSHRNLLHRIYIMQRSTVCKGTVCPILVDQWASNTLFDFKLGYLWMSFGYFRHNDLIVRRSQKAQFTIHSKALTSMGWLFFRASNSRARVKSVEANCVQMSYSGKQWSTHKYSIHEANPSFSHKCVHHSCKHIITEELYDQSKI